MPALTGGRVTFGCFNNPAKLSPPALAAFAAVLRRAPGSRLILKYRGLGDPAGLTLEKFIHTIRTGEDPDAPGQLLQVMVWPVLRNMTDRDLTAIYEYLRSIPHAQPGTACTNAGQ